MDPAMFARMHGEIDLSRKSKDTSKQSETLPKEMKACLDYFLRPIIEQERELYQSDLESFEQHEHQIRLAAEDVFLQFYSQISHAQALIKEKFQAEDEENPPEDPLSAYSTWETILKSLQEAEGEEDIDEGVIEAPVTETEELSQDLQENEQEDESEELEEETGDTLFQEYLGMPWPFMDRVYQYAKTLLQEGKYSDAQALYLFLRYLNRGVYEYIVGEAISLQQLGKFQDAIKAYIEALFLRPETPVLFFQIAKCYLQLNNKESCLAALEVALKGAQEEEGSEDLVKNIQNLQMQLHL